MVGEVAPCSSSRLAHILLVTVHASEDIHVDDAFSGTDEGRIYAKEGVVTTSHYCMSE